MDLRTLLRISRPRFWLYLGGTFLLGAACAAPSLAALSSATVALMLVYFLLPANLFLYGINDLADADTDAHNAKKGTKEHKLLQRERRALSGWVWLTAFISAGVAFAFAWQGAWLPSLLVLLFLALAAGYSAAPVRFKARPLLDSASNVLYVVPGLVGYAMFARALPAFELIVAFACWTAAMHLFSAIPDIAADKRAKLSTTATMLGQKRSLLACSTLWLVFAVIVVTRTSAGWLFAPAFVYVAVPLALVGSSVARIDKVYWWFPIFTGVIGFLVFWYVIIARFSLDALFALIS